MTFNYLFEVSWEVCNKVGGIYTVLSSKARLMKDKATSLNFSHYYVGPFLKANNSDFVEEEVPAEFKSVFEKLKSQGIVCHFGTWPIISSPKAILVEYLSIANRKNEIKGKYWDLFKVDSLFSSWEFDEPIMWSTAVGILIEEFEKQNSNKKIIAHFHEWMAGAGLLYLKGNKSYVKTVFTTHATILGRTLSSNNFDLMKNGTNVNPEYEAKKFNIMDKHTAEVACANFSDVFTTVSDITANETKYLLHKVPDFVLKNGIDSDAFGTTEYLLERDSKFKEKIRDIVADQFFPYYTFDLDETSFIFTSGRYEFHDKGVDVFIKSLAKLNAELKNPANKASDRTVVAFFFMPAGQHGITTEFNENKGKYGLDKREGCPALTTHYMNEEGNDPIIRSLRQNDLINKREDNVKVLFVPIYLEKTDGIFNLPYYETISGFDLGVFGSYYEPWGYTPQECLALAIPTVTTNYAGFGSFMDKNVKDKFKRMKGSYVADRSKTEEECVEEISKHLLKFVKKYRPEKRDCKIVAKELSRIVDWKIFVENYMKAYEMAEKK